MRIRRRRQPRSAAVKLRDNVLAIVAHDIKTPIGTIMMAADLLADQEPDPRKRHFLDIIKQAARQADGLVRDLVDAERIEVGVLRVECHEEPIGYLLESITENFEQQAEQAGLDLVCDVTGVRGVFVCLDIPRFVQVMSNLISNALKFTPRGGAIVVSAALEKDFVRVRVRDSGVGIKAEELPHVFERFWQAAHQQRAGAGLGLAIARGIVEAHGGTIRADSAPGLGATFSFTLPLACTITPIPLRPGATQRATR